MVTPNEPTLSPTSLVVPAHRFVGEVQANGLKAQVTSLACSGTGEIVLMTMNGPRTTVSAVAATLHKGGRARTAAHFMPASGEQWRGPDRLYRMEGLGSGWIASSVDPTTQLDVAVLAHGANMVYCRQHPLAQPKITNVPIPECETPQRLRPVPKLPLSPPRFLLANEGADHPDWMTFTGLMRTLWLPFPPSFAPLIWNVGLHMSLELAEDESAPFEDEHTLIEPVACALGITAWQIFPAKQWQTLLERASGQAVILGL